MRTHDRSIHIRSGWRSVAMGAALLGVLAAPTWALAGPHHDGPDTIAEEATAAFQKVIGRELADSVVVFFSSCFDVAIFQAKYNR